MIKIEDKVDCGRGCSSCDISVAQKVEMAISLQKDVASLEHMPPDVYQTFLDLIMTEYPICVQDILIQYNIVVARLKYEFPGKKITDLF